MRHLSNGLGAWGLTHIWRAPFAKASTGFCLSIEHAWVYGHDWVVKDCLECARLREQSASLYADYVAARDDLAVTRENDPQFTAKRSELKRIQGRLRESYKLSRAHEAEVHASVASN